MMTARCDRCRFWAPNGDTGECRRLAPQGPVVLPGSIIVPPMPFARTMAEEWCGQFKRRRARSLNEFWLGDS